MVYAYYNRLNKRQKGIYRRSDGIESVKLTNPALLTPLAMQLSDALSSENQKATTSICRSLTDGICADLQITETRVKVLARRPSNNWGELHGLYEPAEARQSPQLTVWMRTAQRKQVVAFKTFLRTVLHELCHHLDYELLNLEDSFHTEGFFKRESSLYKQLVPPE
jgi:hypothetical protein